MQMQMDPKTLRTLAQVYIGNFLMKPEARIYFSTNKRKGYGCNLVPLGYQKPHNKSKMGQRVSWKRHIPFEE